MKRTPAYMGWEEVREYLGNAIGRDKIIELMKSGSLPSITIGNKGKLVTQRAYVDIFMDRAFKEPVAEINSMPVGFVTKNIGRKLRIVG